jgi:glycosyltransferase involved in cell wall biosynthesis
VLRTSAAVLATADFRAEWLATRAWLPTRPVVMAPVYSNLPPPAVDARPRDAEPLVGLFGYAYRGAPDLVLEALQLLRKRHVGARLILLGSPGRESSAGREWLAEGRRRGVAEALAFTGVLPAQALSDALARCEVLLFVDPTGPASRKGSLAGSLASGRPVVAIDGPRSWPEFVRCGALALARPTARSLADAIGTLLADEVRREQLGARGRAFARERMGVQVTARAVRELYEEIAARSATRGAPPAASQLERAAR